MAASRFLWSTGQNEKIVLACFLQNIGLSISKNIEKHDKIGSKFLKQMGFSPEIYEPIGLHVQAKRYLYTVDPMFSQKMSMESKMFFNSTQKIMSENEVRKFILSPYANISQVIRHAYDLEYTQDSFQFDFCNILYNYLIDETK